MSLIMKIFIPFVIVYSFIVSCSPATAKNVTLLDHCPSANHSNVFEILTKSDSVFIGKVKVDPMVNLINLFESKNPYKVEFTLEEKIVGNFNPTGNYPVYVNLNGSENYIEQLDKTKKRARDHNLPIFMASAATRFEKFGYAKNMNDSDTCVAIPVMLQSVDYILVLRGDEILSVEPIFEKTDYWYKFITALKTENFWPKIVIQE
jgi:hypothetical protein